MKDNNKYFLYVRKSTDVEDKQVQSLDDQIRVMKQKAKDMWLSIVAVFEESMSAKAPWRFRFNEMIQRISSWEANGIIAWKLDRVSRNPVDSWTIQYMLQTGKLNRIITSDREYNPIDAGLLMSVENGMSNQFIIDLKKNVKRGMSSRYLKWVRPTRAPIWYLNNQIEKTIEVDAERFDLVRKMWDLVLTWNYSPMKINRILADEYGLRTRKMKKSWGKEVSVSGIYRVFHNIFYTGHFYHNGELLKWNHKAMISLDEFDRVQEILWKKWLPRPKTREFPFTGMIKCWECGCSITAEIKKKHIKTTGETRYYTYYHCTKKRRKAQCTQKTVRKVDLEKQISEILDSVEIIPDFKDWAVNTIKDKYEDEVGLKIQQSENINKTILSEEQQLKKLTQVLLKELITDEEYETEKSVLKQKITRLKDKRDKLDAKGKEALDLTINAFRFVCKAKTEFQKWDLETKKSILSTLSTNFILIDKQLVLELKPWFKVIRKRIRDWEWGLKRLEPIKKGVSKGNTNTFLQENSIWFGM